GGRRPPRGTADGPGAHAPGPSRTARGSRGRVRRPPFRRLAPVGDLPPNRHADEPGPLASFEEIIEAEPRRGPGLAGHEVGSRTRRTQGGPPEAGVPARPADPEVDQALREVEAELATRWGETKLEPSVARISALMDVLGEPQRAYPSIHITGTNGKTSTARM